MTLAAGSPGILSDLTMVLGVAAVTTVACQRFRLPVVVGYLFAGLIIGPHVPIPLVANQGNVHTLSELGIILLMFSLGLEFSVKRLLLSGPQAVLVAVIQGGFMAWAGYLAGRFLGWGGMESVFAGAALSISSTMIIVKVFKHLGIHGPFADLVLSTLIVQDLLAILALALLTAVGSGAGLDWSGLLLTLGRLGGFLVAVLVLGRWILPGLIRTVADAGSSETLLVATVGLCFAFSMLAVKAGYSVALGAFLAGMVVAESGRERAVESLILPVRDMFVAVFFVSIGMTLDPALLLPNWRALLVFGTLVLVGKFLSGAVGGLLGGSSLRTSLRAGATLAQIGEFSFIIAALGQTLGVIGPSLLPVLVATCAWTTLATPTLIQRSDDLADGVERRLPRRLHHFLLHHRAAMGHLRGLPFRKDAWRHLRKPFLLLLVDSGVVALVVGFSALIHRSLTPKLEAQGLSHAVAIFLVWLLAGGLTVRFLLSALARIRGIASAITERALSATRENGSAVGDATRFALEIALVGMIGLPLAAILQPMLPPGLLLVPILAGALASSVLLWRRAGAIR